jgi:cellulose synthase operon protein C
MLRRSSLAAFLLLCAVPLLAGCGALFGQRYENFTAYYNTFYNAQRDFEREERAILRADDPVDRSRYLPVFPRPAGGSRPGLEAAIRRSADILRDHPGSRWVDDALLLIGKAYFYQGNFDAAGQKFREVLSLGEGRQSDEAYLWLGRSLMEGGDYPAAAGALREGLARDAVRPRSEARLRLALGEVAVRQGDFGSAAESLAMGIPHVGDPQIEARAAFLLGQVLDADGRFDEAARAYGRVLSSRPSPEIEYAADLQRAKSLSRSGQSGDALNLLDRLRRDDKYFQQRAEVELMRARALAGAGRAEEAADLMRRLLYGQDPGLRIDRVRGQIHLRLGEVYRDHLNQYVRAAAHFDTASTALRQQVVASREHRPTIEAVPDVDRLATSYGTYARVQSRLAEMDSLMYLGSLDEAEFALAIEAIEADRRRAALAAQRERRRIEDQQGFASGAGMGSMISEPTTADAGDALGGGSGFLSFRNPVRVQENLVAFQARWGERPLMPDWRRSAAVSAARVVSDGLADDATTSSVGPPVGAMRESLVDISAIPRTPQALLAMRRDRAAARYELGNVLFLTLGRPDLATDWYRRVIEEDGDFPVAIQAYYALAEAESALGETDTAEAIYRDLVDHFGEDPLARVARQRLGMPVVDLPPDSLQLARMAYAAAFERWTGGQHADALRGMMELDDRFSGSPEAARARLAAGMIYTEWAAPDTALVLAPSPGALLASGVEAVGEQSDSDATDTQDVPHAGDEDLSDAELIPPREDEVAEEASPDADPLAPAGAVEEAGDREENGSLNGAVPAEADTLDARQPVTLATAPEVGEDAPAGEPAAPWLVDLYRSIERDFPGTPFVERARGLRQAVEEQADAYAAARTPEPEEPQADSEGDGMLPPEDAVSAEPFERQDLPAALGTPLLGDARLDAAAGGYSWVVFRSALIFEAQNQMMAFHNRGFRTGLLERLDDTGDLEYTVLVGQFDTRLAALEAERDLPPGVSAQYVEVVALEPGVRIFSVADLVEGDEP